MNIERVAWDDLKPHQENPKNGDVDAISESIRVNGVYRPIICAKDGTILAGNHLYHALGQLGREEVDIIRLDVDPYSAHGKRILLADNKIADLGRYDDGVLAGLLSSLDEEGLAGTGYGNDDLIALLGEVDSPLDLDDVDAGPDHECPSCGFKW